MFGFDFFGSSGAPRARGALVSFRLGLLVDGRRRRRRDLRRVQRRGLLLHHGREVLRPGAGRRARRAHISRLDEVLGHDEPGARGPRNAHLRADLAGRAAAVPGVVQQSRGPAAGGSSAAPLRVLEGAAGAHVREQEEGLLARRERAAARVPTRLRVAQEPDLSCYYSGALRELSSDVVVGAERVGAVPLLHENVLNDVVAAGAGGRFCGVIGGR